MEFRVLGPLEADRNGDPIDLGSPKQREVLSLLLMHAGRPVTSDRLLDAVWGEEAGPNALYVAMSRLRSALGSNGTGELIVTADHGYRLAIDPTTVDAHRFERLVDDARAIRLDDPEGAMARLREGLGLWRGDAWSDVRYRDFAIGATERLDELRVAAEEELVDLRLETGEATSVIPDARRLHEEHPLRERPVELLMVALYRAGRQAEALRVFAEFERRLGIELGLEPTPELRRIEERVLLHDRSVQGARSRSAVTVNPFRGLAPFREGDAADFHGRDRLVDELVDSIASGTTLITLVGASGSGKSSAVFAGLIPRLKKAAVDGSDLWTYAEMVPGSHPFAELEAALIRSAPDPPSSLGEQLGDPGTGILRAALRVLDHDDDRLVVVIDQFEELFTLTEDDAVRSSFLDGLVTAVDDPRRRVVVILTLRADYYHLTLDHAEFSTRFGHGVVNVGPLLPEELESAALLPAQRMGVEIEPALLGTLLSEVIGRPGNLPLFQYTLTDLFDRGGAMLTLEDYEAVGGIAGALARRAEDAYGGFDPDDQAACKQVLMRMVAVGEEGFARRRLSVDGLRALGIDAAAIQRIVGALVDARLVTTDRDQRTGRPTIEVAHEALLAAWPRLAGWLEDASDDLRRHAFLAAAVAEWEASGRDPEYLWHGRRLEDHRSWAADSSLDLSVDEQRFLTEAALRDQEAERARARARRSTRIRTSILAAAVVALVAIGGFVVYQAVQPKPLEVMLLDAPGGGSASASAFAGIEAVADRLDVGVRRIRPGIDTGPEIEAAIAALPDYVVIGRDAAKAFGPFYFEAITERLDTTRFLDFSFGGVEPEGDHPNWTRVAFDQAEAGFLAGVLAAGRTETGVVGFVGGHAAIMEDLRGGFEIGVASVDPSIEVVSAYSPITSVPPLSVYDEASAEQAFETTLRVLDAGADVVLNGHGDAGIGVFRAVASSARDAWAIGVASDQYSDLVESEQRTADHVLASIVYRYDVAIPWAIQRSRAGNDASGDAGLTIGAIDVADPSGNLTEAELASLASATELIIAEGSPDTGLDPRPESWGEAVLPRHGPTELPPDADVIHIALTAEEGMTVTDPGALAVGDTVTAQMDIESQTYWWYWVTIGRLTDLVEERPLPPALDGPGWLQPDYWDIRLPRNWMAIPGRGSSAAMSVVLDRPGTWAVAIGRFDEPGLLSPVEWRTFEVLPASG